MNRLPEDYDSLQLHVNRSRVQEKAALILSTMGAPDDSFYDSAERKDQLRASLKDMVRNDVYALSSIERALLLQVLLDTLVGFDCLGPYIRDQNILQVQVFSPDKITLFKSTRPEDAPIRFRNQDHLYRIRDRLIFPHLLSVSSPQATNDLTGGVYVTARLNVAPGEALVSIIKTAGARSYRD